MKENCGDDERKTIKFTKRWEGKYWKYKEILDKYMESRKLLQGMKWFGGIANSIPFPLAARHKNRRSVVFFAK